MSARRLLWLLLVACPWLALVGCRGSDPSNATSDDAAQRTAQASGSSLLGEQHAGPESSGTKLPSTIQLVDATQRSGLSFVHRDGSAGEFHLMETMTGGLALFDLDGDELTDVFFCNGVDLAQAAQAVSPASPSSSGPAVLFQNLGNLQFRDVTQEARLEGLGYGMGVAVGDFDNDGFRDLYVSNFGPNQLWRNNGDGTFSLESSSTQLANGDRFGAGVCFADVNGNGGLDLVVGNYVQYALADVERQSGTKRQQYQSPQDFSAETLTLLINDLAGGWDDRSRESGLAAVAGTSMGIICGDFDLDGSIDVYVANDEMQNFLFLNDGQANFRESGFLWGVAVDAKGNVNGSMGVDCADADNDGRPDLLVTSFERELVTLYRGTDQDMFLDATRSSRMGDGTEPHVTWGCCWADLDNDGDRDAFIASGHLDERQQNAFYRVANLVLRNEWIESNRLSFSNITQVCGDVAGIAKCSRGAAVADLDNDGDLDVMVLNRGEEPTLLENVTRSRLSSEAKSNSWLELELVGRYCNRDAIGARVRVTVAGGELTLYDEMRSGRGYQSHWGNRVHFGLGDSTEIESIEVTWPDGAVQEVSAPTVNRRLTIVQQPRSKAGAGEADTSP